MPLPKFASDLFAGPSKRSLTMIVVLGVLILGIVFIAGQIRPAAEAKLIAALKAAGFSHITINELSLYPHGLQARDIKLDQYGFDTIGTLDAAFSWPSFLGAGKVSGVEIKNVSLSRTYDDFPLAGQQITRNLLNLPAYRMSISNATIDLDTGFGSIRIVADITTEPTSAGEHSIQAAIRADQYQLGFNSTWQGTLKQGGMLDLGGNVVDGRLDLGHLRLSRFNGWVGATVDESGYRVQSQLQAGSASFMDVPLQDVSVVNDTSSKQNDVIIRSGISGMPDILFTADMKRTDKEHVFSAVLKGKNLGGLLDYVDEKTEGVKTINDTLLSLRAFEITATLQPEKRFVGGPFPFGVSLRTDGQSVLDGNILFYPDTFDVRGSLETQASMARALQDYFKIPSRNIVQNFIRLDGDARNFLGFGESQSSSQQN